MPSHSVKQAKVMSAIAHGWKPTGSAAKIPLSVAEEFHEADKGHKYGAERAMGGVIGQPMPPMPNQIPPQMPGNGVAGAAIPGAIGMPPAGINAPMAAGMPARAYAFGGGVAPIQKTFKGPIISSVPGRTDNHFGHVPSGSYVIPADIVSGHGQGNSLAGMNALQKLFKMGPHNSMNSRLPYGGNHMMSPPKSKGGGAESHVGKPVPVKLAGGEIVVSPEHVHETMQRICKKKMTLDECHAAMDAWVVKQRRKLRRTLAKLPGPAKD